ncbi:MAG TPA: sigma 54-interacting transcriptional regulator [Polyangia bacterium]|nr:sigma 54-interacting transcriptional regulator [Polyangia bacterium]
MDRKRPSPDVDPNPFTEPSTTLPVEGQAPPTGQVRKFRLSVVDGQAASRVCESNGDRCSIGSHEMNDLRLEDATVSRFHCEVKMEPSGARVRDLDSRNGTIVDGVTVFDALLRDGSLLRLGRATVRFELGGGSNRLPVSQRSSFGSMVGRSVAMRTSFALMERAAETDFTVLLEGETGTGKGEAAEAIHAASARRAQPMLVVDCGAIPENLLESELFGHEKGAFTGAETRRIGAFEEASGGTIFLDEIGELSPDLQPKLLRVLENREIRRVGTNTYRPVDVRVIAATNRDLRAEVNAGRFRPDLFFRLAVVKIPLPSLRQRPEDLPVLVERLLHRIGADEAACAPLRDPAFLAGLSRAAWPGNVRELRNYLEQCLVFRDSPAPAEAPPAAGAFHVDAELPYAEARRRALDQFEALYLEALLQKHDGKVTQAAQAADITRVHLYRLLRRHGIKP